MRETTYSAPPTSTWQRLASRRADGSLNAYADACHRHEWHRTARLSRSQAEGITEARKELDTSSLTTKADLKYLELRLYKYLGGILIAHSLGTAALTVALTAQLIAWLADSVIAIQDLFAKTSTPKTATSKILESHPNSASTNRTARPCASPATS